MLSIACLEKALSQEIIPAARVGPRLQVWGVERFEALRFEVLRLEVLQAELDQPEALRVEWTP